MRLIAHNHALAFRETGQCRGGGVFQLLFGVGRIIVMRRDHPLFGFLCYLELGQPSPTLSGGESQRIRLASQIGCGLVGVLYILDEPSIGLHQRDNKRLLNTLRGMRDLGNTVLVV